MTTGIEYNITPSGSDSSIFTGGGENQWANTPIGVPTPNPLNNFRVGVRYYEDRPSNVAAPPGPEPDPDNPDRAYPGFELISQTLECISTNNGDVFVEGTPPLYEDYPEFPTFTAPLEDYGADVYAIAGITDGAAYQYSKVFDQTEFRLIPDTFVLSDQPPDIEVDDIPEQPFDPENDIFPYKSITAYNPDVRDAVLATYELTTTLEGNIAIFPDPEPDPDAPVTVITRRITETINITQWVTQSINDWGPACRYYVCKGEYSYKSSTDNYCPVVPWVNPP